LIGLGVPRSALSQTIDVSDNTTFEVRNNGTVDLEGATMDFGSAGSSAQLVEASGGRVAGGHLEATRALDAPSGADPAGLGLQITASEDLGDVTVTRGHTVQTDDSGSESIERFYDVSPSQNNDDLDAELTFSYADAELNGRSESALEFFKSTDGGSSWSEEGQDSRDASANTVTLEGIESFSRWTLGSEDDPLPVELASFEATQAEQDAVELQWTTASEENNAEFEVQHRRPESGSGEADWSTVGTLESKAEGGTTDDATSYRYTAEDLPSGTHAFRLKQTDRDGTEHVHDPVDVKLKMQDAVRLDAPAPNPVQAQATLSFAVKERAETRVTVYNTLGQKVATVYQGTPAPEETQTATLSATDLASGVYFLRLEADGHTETQRMTVTH
ncbi:MAG: T9SS type A sorting domain-containing protein, partial [Salinivenus sp.]